MSEPGHLAAAALFSLFPLVLFAVTLDASVYRVGPGETYPRVSEVCDRLGPGDVVEITGDISETFTLSRDGTADAPIVVRGVTKAENGQIVRPRITPPEPSPVIITCRGDWTTLEGLDVSGQAGTSAGQSAVVQAGGNLVLRNCRFHHNQRVIWGVQETAGDVVVEFCEFDSNGRGAASLVNLLSARPGAKAIVRHCYFHDDTGGGMLRCCVDETAICYNWFENPYWFAIKVSTAPFFKSRELEPLADKVLPSHCDIVGNVVIFGYGPGQPFWGISLGGDSPDSPGTEGDFNIAHNLFVSRRGGAAPQVQLLVQGNVDHVNLFNNVFLEWGSIGGCKISERGEVYSTPRTQMFIRRRGNGDPAVAGHGNWFSSGAWGIPPEMRDNTVGGNPLLRDLVGGDFRPAEGSPLAAGGLWPLPEGKVTSLTPEYEPHRGIRADLQPIERRRATPPSIGPFEADDTDGRPADDSAELVLAVKSAGGRCAWRLPFAVWRRRSVECLWEGRTQEALACAKVQFLLSPPDNGAIAAAVESVKQALVAADGGDMRASLFEQYAVRGQAGEDGLAGTADDLKDPIGEVDISIFQKDEGFYAGIDRALDEKMAFCSDPSFLFDQQDRCWYATEKAYARLESADFERALPMLTAVLLETDRQVIGDIEESPVAQRNQDVLDRIANGLYVIAKSRTDSTAGAAEFAGKCMAYANYGPAGKDGVAGTGDDIEVRWGEAQPVRVVLWPSIREDLDHLKASRPDDPLVGATETGLMDLARVQAMTVYQFEFLRTELKSAYPTGFAFVKPSPHELFAAISLCIEAGVADIVGRDEALCRLLQTARDAADATVIAAYKEVVADSPSEGVSRKARAYLTAYVLACHDELSYPAVLLRLATDVASSGVPCFLIEDAVESSAELLAAGRALDSINRTTLEWPAGERDRVVKALEKAECKAIEAAELRISGLAAAKGASEYETVLALCDDYLLRFSQWQNAERVTFQRAFYLYRAGKFEDAVKTARDFLQQRPTSPLCPSARFIEGLGMSESLEKRAAVDVLISVADRYPESLVAARSLVAAGYMLSTWQEYRKAADCLRRVVDFYPKDRYASKATEMLGALEANLGKASPGGKK